MIALAILYFVSGVVVGVIGAIYLATPITIAIVEYVEAQRHAKLRKATEEAYAAARVYIASLEAERASHVLMIEQLVKRRAAAASPASSTVAQRAEFVSRMVANLRALPLIERLSVAMGIYVDTAAESGLPLERHEWSLRKVWELNVTGIAGHDRSPIRSCTCKHCLDAFPDEGGTDA